MRKTCSPAICLLSLFLWLVPSLNANAEAIAVIVNPSNPSDNIKSRDLARVYSGKMRRWPDGQKFAIINRPIDSEIRRIFYRVILKAKPTKKFFKSKLPLAFKMMKLKSGMATRKFVTHIKNAVGYIYLSEVDDTVKVLTIDGKSPGEKGYKLN